MRVVPNSCLQFSVCVKWKGSTTQITPYLIALKPVEESDTDDCTSEVGHRGQSGEASALHLNIRDSRDAERFQIFHLVRLVVTAEGSVQSALSYETAIFEGGNAFEKVLYTYLRRSRWCRESFRSLCRNRGWKPRVLASLAQRSRRRGSDERQPCPNPKRYLDIISIFAEVCRTSCPANEIYVKYSNLSQNINIYGKMVENG